ncbi:YjdF family protein [Clostridium ganghwense]|uniref:YjdF family protein n=1 Tax=Clostridium ganghwense TaxID=312089 RepID=A0ABT4CKC8_9CLOT|nr:YjdF family protein [Clostridium ganghwense]MCY6369502.1 YjdF family protein [Clostridium ganghwense]
MSIKLIIYFEDPFWVGIFEKTIDKEYEICKVTFGPEPKDYEVYEFILKNFHKLKFSRPKKVENIKTKKINPKRLQKKIKKETQNKGISTKAQEAMKLEFEARKKEKKVLSKERKEEIKREKFLKKQQKKKQKKKGR